MPQPDLSALTAGTQTGPRQTVLQALSQPSLPGSSLMGVAVKDGTADDTRPALSTGEEQVFSFFQPSLEAGDYLVTTTQTISARDNPTIVTQEEQAFTVSTPRFSLPDSAVKSVYPPPGYLVAVETLPHIVFSDPYLPWERQATSRKRVKPHRVPWLALLAFTDDELVLPEDQRTGDASIFKNVPNDKAWEQSPSLSMTIPPGSVSNVISCATPITSTSAEAADPEKIEAIFLRPGLFNELFRDNRVPAGDQKHPDVSRYKYLSHVRRLDTTGMAESGGSKEASYSLVLSHRVGALVDSDTGTTVHAHLVSLEGIEAMTWPVQAPNRYVALVSLHSWTYTSGRTGVFDVKRSMQNLANTLGPLRAQLPAPDTPKAPPESQIIVDRLQDGYTPVRYRMQTGEVTAGFYRGVLTPTQVQHPISRDWSLHSDSGMDLHILDSKLGLPDITYSAAWQLGKSTAMADQAFCRALTKLRRQIHVMAMNRAKAKLMHDVGTYQTRNDVVEAAPVIVKELRVLQDTKIDELPPSRNPDMLDRWASKPKKPIDLSLDNDTLAALYDKQAVQAAKELGRTVDDDEGVSIYNELNQAANPEWPVVLGWVLDKMYLSTIPTQYLVTDPSHLPAESLRFFHIDPNWVDAFLDGALSLGNHLEHSLDSVRTAIKRLVNNYLGTPLPSTGKPPPVPTYGFILRSDIVSHFPDLRVEAEYDPPRANSAMPSILRQANVSNGILLCLLDATPYGVQPGSRLTCLKFTQPPHQQSFAVGDQLDEKELRTSYASIYTAYGGSDQSAPRCKEEVLPREMPMDKAQPPIFDWGKDNSVRCLQFPAFSDRLVQNLRDHMPRDRGEAVHSGPATSAMVGLQLTKRICELKITATADSASQQASAIAIATVSSSPTGPRALWIPQEPKAMRSMTNAATSPGLRGAPVAPLPAPGKRHRQGDASRSGDAPHMSAARAPSKGLGTFVGHLLAPKKILTSAVAGVLAPAPPHVELPRYDLQVFPVGKPFDPAKDARTIPMGRRRDLVFSVTLTNLATATPGTLVDEIRIVLPMGKPNPAAAAGKTKLMRDYRGPGAAMVGNLRFNVISAVGADYSYMLIRLVPRAAKKGCIRFELALEVSFVLSLVDVNEYPAGKERTIQIRLVEHLRNAEYKELRLEPRIYKAVLRRPLEEQDVTKATA